MTICDPRKAAAYDGEHSVGVWGLKMTTEMPAKAIKAMTVISNANSMYLPNTMQLLGVKPSNAALHSDASKHT